MEDFPNENNSCGGNFQDWLEVMLTPKCNGKCNWCVEKDGYKPKEEAAWYKLLRLMLSTGRDNFLLLGGEPTLYRNVDFIISSLRRHRKNVFLTTNGSQLDAHFAKYRLDGLTGLNISIHHYDLGKNKRITGIGLEPLKLHAAIKWLKKHCGTRTRFNCNLIKGCIDSDKEMRRYVDFAKSYGADNVRFSELQEADEQFVDLAKTLNYKYGLNDDPYKYGCHSRTMMRGLPVNFKQMCGFLTKNRPMPNTTFRLGKIILYYNGVFYDGWQGRSEEMKKARKPKKKATIKSVLKRLTAGEITEAQAEKLIKTINSKVVAVRVVETDSDGCPRGQGYGRMC